MANNTRSIYSDYVLFPCLILFVISFPLPIAYNSILTILFSIVFLAGIRNLKNNIRLYFSNISNILLLIIFLSLLVSVLYSDDKKAAMKGILVALPLLSIPLCSTLITNLSSRQIHTLKKAFVFSCFIISVIYFIQTTIRIGLWDGSYKLQTGPVGYRSPYLVYNLTYHQLTPSIHSVFFSLYLAVAVLIIIFGFERQTLIKKILQRLLVLYFLVYLVLLTSASINFGLYSFLAGSIFSRYSFKKLSHYLLFFGVIIIGTAITDYLLIVKYIGPDIGNIVYQFDSASINQKILNSYFVVISASAVAITIKLIIKKNNTLILAGLILLAALFALFYLKKITDNKNKENWKVNNVTVRVSYGAEAIRIIKANPFTGVGIGDKKYKLIERDTTLGDKRYVEFGLNTKPDDVFNPHNQFLDFWIAAGIIPVICLLLFFINQFSKAVRYKNILYLGLLFCFCLFCFTDMPMMVQRGQIFFLYFICLFEIESRKKMTPPSLS
ncbi:MAG TPA: O-antigen ligase family protein [Chitinophagaceae bacterium]|nr:O-antigen ligase family protein [Chitinophagaceae bacterium]